MKLYWLLNIHCIDMYRFDSLMADKEEVSVKWQQSWRMIKMVFAPYLMCQDVNVVTNIAWWCRVLLLPIFALLWLFHLYLPLHVGLFDHLHLQAHSLSNKIRSKPVDDMHVRAHQLLWPHVVQDSLGSLAVMATLHNCKKELRSIILQKNKNPHRNIKLLFWRIYNWVHLWCKPKVWTCTELVNESSYHASEVVDIAVRPVGSCPSHLTFWGHLRLTLQFNYLFYLRPISK